ncbi:MAG: hypothetical protein II695_08400 [Oscillospiraceae bacterium]|nr:hypothetical protein [Oscillospiraceae bacterium]
MDRLQMAEILVKKCGITYEEAAAVIEESGGDLLEAMILLEKRGLAPKDSGAEFVGNAAVYPVAKRPSDADSFKEFINSAWNTFISAVKVLFKSFLVIDVKGKSAELPLLLMLVLLIAGNFPAVLIFIITLAAGIKYRIRIKE